MLGWACSQIPCLRFSNVRENMPNTVRILSPVTLKMTISLYWQGYLEGPCQSQLEGGDTCKCHICLHSHESAIHSIISHSPTGTEQPHRHTCKSPRSVMLKLVYMVQFQMFLHTKMEDILGKLWVPSWELDLCPVYAIWLRNLMLIFWSSRDPHNFSICYLHFTWECATYTLM